MAAVHESWSVDVVLATYNSAPYIDACLASLSLISTRWQLLVADNSSDDDTIARVLDAVPDAVVVRNSANLGFGQAINAAVSRGSSDLILVLNPDAMLADDPTPLLEMVREEDMILSGLMSGTDGSLRSNAFRFPTWRTIIKVSEAHIPTENILRQLHTEESIPVDYVEGSFFLLRRHTMERLGGFSPSYFMYGEDRDLSLRAATMGVPTRLANRVSHRHDGGFSPRRQPWYVTGVLTFVRENTPRRLFLVRQLLRMKFLLKLVRAAACRNSEDIDAARATLNAIGNQAQQ